MQVTPVLTISVIESLRSAVGADHLEARPARLAEITHNTLHADRDLVARVRPGNQDEVRSVLAIARKFRVPLYPVSTGRNWGYGGASPVTDGCILLDLSRLKRITNFNPELGTITVEPGVTQQDLYDYLQAQGGAYMVPTTGAGPRASILGNALERGYGITPHEDHFGAVLGFKSLLADGQVYQSALRELGGEKADAVFKWKIGPYLDGLSTQSNYGIVIEATIALARKPESVTQFVVTFDDSSLEAVVAAVARIRQKLPGIVGGINLMNQRRVLAMIEPGWSRDQVMSEARVKELAGKRDIGEWTMLGAIYGTSGITREAVRIIRKETRPFARRFVAMDRRKHRLLTNLLRFLPLPKFRKLLESAGRGLDVIEGIPSEVAIPLAYLKNEKPFQPGKADPDQDECGLIWFAPLMPIDPAIVREFAEMTRRTCLRHGVEPLITLTSISERCFDSTVPLLFSQSVPGAKEAAERCLQDLLAGARNLGIFPYRLDIERNAELRKAGVPAFDIARKIKKALDPDGILAPGRYVWDGDT